MHELINELVRHYFGDCVYEIEPVPFGLTNFTKIVTINDQKYVIRIYNPYTKNVDSIAFEAELTSYISKQNLSIVVPEFLNTNAGERYVQLSNGSLGAVVSFIEGVVPEIFSIEQAKEFGYVVGEMTSVLGRYQSELQYEGVPFTELYNLHPLADYQAVTSFFKSPPFEIPQAALHFYQKTVALVESNKLEWLGFSKQLVHHDLLIFNLLSIDNRIHGVLDFDNTSLDIGFMEFAISLNHVIQMSNGSLEMAQAFIEGYSRFRTCTDQEINQLQRLTQMYHIAVLHIYIGQYYSGRDIEENFNYILTQFHTRNDWLNEHESLLKEIMIGEGDAK
ncbi:phosphotransferase enzyme family protein [Paenibacillus sinopodophylli]|uniref:phosphotransferase enzyme family protein n=1 Tax=Paenibacillus sinopodophylli TaxID=1837342 RepID=UPI00110CE946|nr:phosphotransferase [Paenibacillus sinopodophylli]